MVGFGFEEAKISIYDSLEIRVCSVDIPRTGCCSRQLSRARSRFGQVGNETANKLGQTYTKA